ncbi:MAG: mechanosensitive ion channel family protein [Acidimicrobiia bacterium]
MAPILGQAVTDNIEEMIDVSAIGPWDLLWAALLIVGGVILAALVRRPLRARLTDRTQLPEGPVNLLTKLVGWAVIAVATVFALPYLGVNVTPVFVLILIIGVVLVVSGRSLVENYGAGVVLQAEGNFRPGDQVISNGYMGKVIRVSTRVLKIETLDGKQVVIPNSSALSAPM